jgi:hypothetical protein
MSTHIDSGNAPENRYKWNVKHAAPTGEKVRLTLSFFFFQCAHLDWKLTHRQQQLQMTHSPTHHSLRIQTNKQIEYKNLIGPYDGSEFN